MGSLTFVLVSGVVQILVIMLLSHLRRIGADMRRVQIRGALASLFAVILSLVLAEARNGPVAQSRGESTTLTSSGKPARPVIIPLTIRVKGQVAPSELQLQTVDLTVNEDGEPQTILSVRAMGTNSPINLFVLIQDDLIPSIGLRRRSRPSLIRTLWA